MIDETNFLNNYLFFYYNINLSGCSKCDDNKVLIEEDNELCYDLED